MSMKLSDIERVDVEGGQPIIHSIGRMSMVAILSRHWAVDAGVALAIEQVLNSTSIVDLERLRIEHLERETAIRDSRRSNNQDTEDVMYEMSPIHEGLALISLTGVMTKRTHCLAQMFGGGGASTLQAETAFRQAQVNPNVRDIAFILETPGGDVNGSFDLANTVFDVNKTKDVYTYITDQATSGGTLVGSQGSRVFANDNGLSGSIGVYTTLVDSTEAYKQRGMQLHVVKAGKYKAIGAPGQPISEQDLAIVQDRVNDYHKLFLKAIVRQRNLTREQLNSVSDAQVFVGSKGVDTGLVDEIASFDDAIKMARAGKGRINNKKGKTVMTVIKPKTSATEDNSASISDDELIASVIDPTEETVVEDSTVVDDTTIVDDTTTVSETEPTVTVDETINITNTQWASIANHFGLTNVTEGNAEANISELIRIGQKYDLLIRDNANKMSIAAGLGDMNTFVQSLPHDNVLAHLKSVTETAKAKGLLSGNRVSIPVDNSKVGAKPSKARASDGGSDTTDISDQISNSRKELASSGAYGF